MVAGQTLYKGQHMCDYGTSLFDLYVSTSLLISLLTSTCMHCIGLLVFNKYSYIGN